MEFNEFEAGSIHKKEFFGFWKEVLEASEWVLNTLAKGYLIPFREDPPEYGERNNKTARDEMKLVRGIISEMISKGIVYVVKEKPRCVNPLGLVSKKQENGSVKHRLVLDVSRHVNTFIEMSHVRLSHLDKALEMTEQGDFQIVYDLTSAYYHIKIEDTQHKFLGACFENSDGSKVYIQYGHLPFGVASAVHCITKLWKPISGYLNKEGIRNSIYIDDGRILSRNTEEAKRNAIRVYNTITKAGWTIEKAKSDGIEQSETQKVYLGMIIDTEEMLVKAPNFKLGKLEENISQMLSREMTPVKSLASILGQIIAIEHSHGMLSRISTRIGYAIIAKHTEKFGWKGLVQVSEDLKRELSFFKEHMYIKNGGPIKSSLTDIRLETIIRNPIARKLTLSNHVRGEEFYVSDASDSKVFVYNLKDSSNTILETRLSEEQKQWSSGARELMALLLTIKQWKIQQIRKRNIYWITDSENVVAFIKKGSRRPQVQKIIFELALLASELEIHIEAIHLLRSDPRIEIADAGSKRKDSDNWSVDAWSFQRLEHLMGEEFEMDVFADHLNRRTAKFFSLYYDEDTQGVDAFAQDWSKAGTLWICPPISGLIQTYRKIMRGGGKGVLILPMWETSTYFSYFFEDSKKCKSPFEIVMIWKPYIIQNEDARDTALFGSVPFDFAALKFNGNKS